MFSLVLSASRPRCPNSPRFFGSSRRPLTSKSQPARSSTPAQRPRPRDKEAEKIKYLARWDSKLKKERTWNITLIRGNDPIFDPIVALLSSLTTYNPFMLHPSSRVRDSVQLERGDLPNWLSPKVFVPPVERASPTRDDVELIAQISGRPWTDIWNAQRHGAAPTHSVDEFVRYAEQNPGAVRHPVMIVREESVVSGVRRILRKIKEWKQDADRRERHEMHRLASHMTPVATKEMALRRKLYREVYGPGTVYYMEIGERLGKKEKRREREKEKNIGLYRAMLQRRQIKT